MTQFPSDIGVPLPLDSVLCTERLSRRSARQPDYQLENDAYSELAQALVDSPHTFLQRLVEVALRLCDAGSAGVSLIRQQNGKRSFYWPAIAGQWQSNIGGGMPIDASPCGLVIQRNAVQLFSYPERHYAYSVPIDAPIAETLLAPLHSDDQPIGTLWLVAHHEHRQFDLEDARRLTRLARFASAAYHICTALQVAEEHEQALRDSELGYRSVAELCPDGVLINAGGRFVYANAAAIRLLGAASVDQVIGHSPFEFLDPELHNTIRERIQSVLQKQQTTPQLRYQWTRIDGTKIDIEVTKGPIRWEGDLAVLVMARDITTRKQHQRALAQRAAEQASLYRLTDRLHRALSLEEIYETALDAILDALQCDRASILLTDSQGAMQFAAWRGLSDDYRRAGAGQSPWSPDDADPQPIQIADISTAAIDDSLRRVIQSEGIAALGFIPLVSHGKLMGKFMVYHDTQHTMNEHEIGMAQTIARQVAFVVQRHITETQRQRIEAALRDSESQQRGLVSRLKLLLETTSHLIKSLEVGELLRSVLDISRELVAADAFAVWRVDEEGTWSVVASKGLSEEFIAETLQATGPVGLPDEPVVVQPADLANRSTPVLRERWSRYEREGIKSLMILPLRIHGELSGTLVFYSRQPHEFTGIEVELAKALGNIAAAAITTAELYKVQAALRRRAEEAHVRDGFLAAAGAVLSQSLEYEQTLVNVAKVAVPEFAGWCAVDLLDELGQLQRLAIAHVDPEKVALAWELYHRFPRRDEIPVGPTHVLRTEQPQVISEIPDSLLEQVTQGEEHLRILRELGLHSMICVPLRAGGQVCGAMTFVSATSQRRFTAKDLSVAEEIARRAAQAIDNSRLYRDLQKSEEALRDADRRKDEFLAMLAHELRNPLAPIRSGLELLTLSGIEHQSIDLMREQLEHLVRLVDDLLDVSRIMRGKVQLRLQKVELASTLHRAIEPVREFISQQAHQIDLLLPAKPVWVEADPVRLAQVITNLLNNAAKYTEPGGRIRVTINEQNGHAHLAVRDNGMGIDPELLPRVFDLFAQADRSLERSQGGLGIGLTLVRSLVEMHGGTVTAHSDGLGKGSEFGVRLPVVEADDLSVPAPQVNEPAVSRRILVVDDNEAATRMLELLLRHLGNKEVHVAYDGPSAVEVAQAQRPELILLDIGLPRMSGYEVAKALRSQPQFDRTLLVALTGYGSDEDRRKSLEAGFDAHHVKPLTIEDLGQLLNHEKLARP